LILRKRDLINQPVSYFAKIEKKFK